MYKFIFRWKCVERFARSFLTCFICIFLPLQLGSRTWCGQTYNNVFKGETLLNVLLKDPLKYPSRGEALQYGQELLDTQAITCITKRRTFEDGDRLYSVSQSVLGKNDRVFLGKVAKKSPSTKTATQKETVSKQNSPEVRYFMEFTALLIFVDVLNN